MDNIYYYKEGCFSSLKTSNEITLCLGFFDGVHLGHQDLVKKACKDNSNVYVLTFDGCLKDIISKRHDQKILTTIQDRYDIFSKLNVKGLLVVPFTREFMDLEPQEFIEKYLKQLPIKNIYVGSDFSFGRGGKGNVELLKKYYQVNQVDFTCYEERKISTSNIFNLIKQGDIKEANLLLNRLYSIKGKIIHGLNNGSKILLPTANLECSSNYLIPGNGVYATLMEIANTTYLGMTNIGVHPTIDQLEVPSIETNIFEFNGNIYDSSAILYFIEKTRDEKKFNSIEELNAQLHSDRNYIYTNFSQYQK